MDDTEIENNTSDYYCLTNVGQTIWQTVWPTA